MTVQLPTALPDGPAAIRTRSLTKKYKKHSALNDVDMTVPEGAFYALVGANGAGKTTLFKLLLELIAPTSGAMDVLGIDPVRDGARVRAHVGYVPERSDDLYTWMSVRRAIEFHRQYYPAWDAAYAAELVKRLNIKEGKLSRLSKGEVRRVQLVMALAHRPPILLLDEPSDGLDPIARDVFYGILAEHIASAPTTVVVSTHLVSELERLADHLAVLSEGRLVTQLTISELNAKLKRYVVGVGNEQSLFPPADSAVMLNGSERERAWTLWGDEHALSASLQKSGAELRAVRSLTLHEAAVAFLSQEAQ